MMAMDSTPRQRTMAVGWVFSSFFPILFIYVAYFLFLHGYRDQKSKTGDRKTEVGARAKKKVIE